MHALDSRETHILRHALRLDGREAALDLLGLLPVDAAAGFLSPRQAEVAASALDHFAATQVHLGGLATETARCLRGLPARPEREAA